MVAGGAVAGIAVVALGLVLTPGPNMLYLVSRSLTQGRRAGLLSLLGVALGFLLYLVAAVLGLTVVFAAVPAAYVALKVAGALYLLHLAWQAVRPRGGSPFAPEALRPDPPVRLVVMGLVTNLLNPKIAVLYVALLPQFVDPARGSVALQSFLLGATQIAIALTVNALLVLFAASIAAFLAERPSWLRAQRLVMGAVLAGLALRLLADRAPAPVR